MFFSHYFEGSGLWSDKAKQTGGRTGRMALTFIGAGEVVGVVDGGKRNKWHFCVCVCVVDDLVKVLHYIT